MTLAVPLCVGLAQPLVGSSLVSGFGSDPTLIWRALATRSDSLATANDVGPALTIARAGTPSGWTRTNSGLLLEQAAANTVLRDFDPTTGALVGFDMMETRTNLQGFSEDLTQAGTWFALAAGVTSNATNAPTGAATADLLTPDGTSSAHGLTGQSISFTSGLLYTTSVFVKPNGYNFFHMRFPGAAFGGGRSASFNLTGNGSVNGVVAGAVASVKYYPLFGFYRLMLTATATTTASGTCAYRINTQSNGGSDAEETYVGNGTSGAYVWGVDTEQGVFETGYIPTPTAAAATRNGDVASLLLSAIPGYSATQGTLVVDAYGPDSDTSRCVVNLDDGTGNNRISLINNPGGRVLVVTGGVTQADISGGSWARGVRKKLAVAWANNDVELFLDGVSLGTDVSVTLPALTTLRFGNYVGGILQPNQPIMSAALYNVRKTPAQVAAL